jgi:hypothetical protein
MIINDFAFLDRLGLINELEKCLALFACSQLVTAGNSVFRGLRHSVCLVLLRCLLLLLLFSFLPRPFGVLGWGGKRKSIGWAAWPRRLGFHCVYLGDLSVCRCCCLFFFLATSFSFRSGAVESLKSRSWRRDRWKKLKTALQVPKCRLLQYSDRDKGRVGFLVLLVSVFGEVGSGAPCLAVFKPVMFHYVLIHCMVWMLGLSLVEDMERSRGRCRSASVGCVLVGGVHVHGPRGISGVETFPIFSLVQIGVPF